jgi:hypothetical protein
VRSASHVVEDHDHREVERADPLGAQQRDRRCLPVAGGPLLGRHLLGRDLAPHDRGIVDPFDRRGDTTTGPELVDCLAALGRTVLVDDDDPAGRERVVEHVEDLAGLGRCRVADAQQRDLTQLGIAQRRVVGTLQEPHVLVEQTEA